LIVLYYKLNRKLLHSHKGSSNKKTYQNLRTWWERQLLIGLRSQRRKKISWRKGLRLHLLPFNWQTRFLQNMNWFFFHSRFRITADTKCPLLNYSRSRKNHFFLNIAWSLLRYFWQISLIKVLYIFNYWNSGKNN
jgi:hypothetical protein